MKQTKCNVNYLAKYGCGRELRNATANANHFRWNEITVFVGKLASIVGEFARVVSNAKLVSTDSLYMGVLLVYNRI